MGRLREGFGWRWRLLRRSWFLRSQFRNGRELLACYKSARPCAEAILRDGTRILHPPGRAGLPNTLIEVMHDGCYNPGHFYRPAPGDVVVDAGANIGIFTLWMARFNPHCRILALEPFAENFRCLETNLRVNRVALATALPIALGGEHGRGVMESGGERSLDHRLRTAEAGSASTAASVEIVSLREVFDLTQTERIQYLKVDIEGSEYDVFAPADYATLRRFDRIALEYHDNLRPGTLRLLQDRLQPTHTLVVEPAKNQAYGMLYATLRR